MKEVKIILADNQPIYREGIKNLFTPFSHLNIVEEVSEGEELRVSLEKYAPEILIIDYRKEYFEKNNVLEWLKEHSNCKVIILSSQDKKYEIFRSLQLNVYAYLTKESGGDQIISAVEGALKDKKFFCDFVLKLMLQQRGTSSVNVEKLTKRELEIAQLIAKGKKNKEIAEELIVSPHTVHTHRKNILKKLNVSSAVELSAIIN